MSSSLTRSAGVLTLALVTGACGSSPGSLMAPTSPSAATSTSQGPAGVGGAGTASVHALSPARHAGEGEVEFRGTIESITPPLLQVAGRLVATDAQTLILRGDATITLADLRVGELVEVDGTTSDDRVLARKIKVEDENEAEVEVEFRGTIESINAPALQVAGRPVTTDASTRILRGDTTITLADLRVGELVEVEGATLGSQVLASKIKVEDDSADDDHGGASGDDGASDDHGGNHNGGSGDDGAGDDNGGHGGGSGDDGGSHGGGGNGSGGN